MADNNYEYECALSGLVAAGTHHFADDNMDDLPVGWTEVRLSRRLFNPKWVLIQQVKKAMIEGLLLQFPEEAREGQKVALQLQIDSQFFNLEENTPVYLTEVETVYLAPPELSEEVGAAYNETREMLGLPPIEEDEGEEEEEPPSKKKEKKEKKS